MTTVPDMPSAATLASTDLSAVSQSGNTEQATGGQVIALVNAAATAEIRRSSRPTAFRKDGNAAAADPAFRGPARQSEG